MSKSREEKNILWFDELRIEDVPLVGGKNASLGEMYRELSSKGVKIPNGFAVTARAYWYFLEQAGIKDKIKEILKGLNTHNLHNLQEKGRQVRETILEADTVILAVGQASTFSVVQGGQSIETTAAGTM